MARTPRTKEQNQRYYQNRNIRAINRGLTGYAQWRTLSKRARDQGLDPNAPIPPDQEPPGLQGPFGPSPDPDWDYWWPTATRQPSRKYSQFARYSRRYQRMEIVFRDGTPWHWGPDTGKPFEPLGWEMFRRGRSTWDQILPKHPARDSSVRNSFGDGAAGGWGSMEYGG